NEPTAASLAYGLHRLGQGVIAVYDLGGGTFDISILRVKDGIFEVLATNGDTHLGGDDFDRVLMLWLLEDVQARHHRELDRDCVELARDGEAMQELRLAAEAAKIRLSTEERTTLTLPLAGFTYHRVITRAEIERLLEPLVSRTLGPCRQPLADARLTASGVDPDPSQHDHPDQRPRDVYHVRRRPDGGRHARRAGRARAGQGQPLAGALRAARHRSDAGRHAEDRGDVPHRRQRHPPGPGAGAAHRQGGVHRGE